MDLSAFPCLPLLVFVAELSVVTLGTMRIIFLSRGMKLLAPVLGFFEIAIWLFAIGQIMRNLSDVGCYAGFAAGFTLGNYLGVLLEKKLALGKAVVHVITHRDPQGLFEKLRTLNFGVTSMEGRGSNGPVHVLLTVVKRRDLDNVGSVIREFDPQAFYSVHDLRVAVAGIFPAHRGRFPGTGNPQLPLFRQAG